MCLDCCGHCEEQTYEESDTLDPLILSNGEEPRPSVIWKLAEAVRFAKTCLNEKAHDIKIYGLLLTEANILNAYNLYELWDKHNVTAIDDLKRLKYKAIRVNSDSDLTCKNYIDFLIDTSFNEVNFDEPAASEPSKEYQCEDNVDDRSCN
jgi:hypothetical protein